MGLLLDKLFSIIFNRTMGPMNKMQMVDPEFQIIRPEWPPRLYVNVKRRIKSGHACFWVRFPFVLFDWNCLLHGTEFFQPGPRFIFSVGVLQSRIRQLDHQFPGYLSPCPLQRSPVISAMVNSSALLFVQNLLG